MAKLELSRAFPNVSADQLYAGFEPAFAAAGFQPQKLRPIGWLALAKRPDAGGEIQANLSARPGKPATALLIMTGGRQTTDELQPLAEAIWTALAAHLDANG